MTDTTKEAVERHLDISHNHAAGLIPMGTVHFLRAIAAERDVAIADRDAIRAQLATARADAMREAASGRYDAKYGKDWLGMSCAIRALAQEGKA